MPGNAYTRLAETEVAVEELTSNRIEDAMKMLYSIEDGNIFALENYLESTYSKTDMSHEDMKILMKMYEGNRIRNGSEKDTANRLLARIAKFRAEHPWTYTGTMPHTTDPEVEAKLAVILKQARESQK